MTRSSAELQALNKDRKLYPRQSHNHRGEPVFDLSPAKALLREDVKNKLHTTMSSSELRATSPEYMCFKPKKFKDRIPQEVKTQKFLHHLELQRSRKFDDCPKQPRKDTKDAKIPAKAPTKTSLYAKVDAHDAIRDMDMDTFDQFDRDAMDQS
jgi:hypothetical protein